jgi:2-iminobutanoate/2-iminopropanoate deaminase
MSALEKRPVVSVEAPAAIGPYSQAIVIDQFVYTSGQVGFDPVSGLLVEGGIEEQTERVLLNLKAVLEAAGSSLDQVIKTTVFLKDMNDFAAMNAIYGRREWSPRRAPPSRWRGCRAMPGWKLK